MIIYTPGFPPKYVDEPAPTAEVTHNPLADVAAAMALAQARHKQVLTYTRSTAPQKELIQNLRLDGPTMEQWVGAGYNADAYPPDGYAELPSAMLDAHKALQATLLGQKVPHSVNDKPVET